MSSNHTCSSWETDYFIAHSTASPRGRLNALFSQGCPGSHIQTPLPVILTPIKAWAPLFQVCCPLHKLCGPVLQLTAPPKALTGESSGLKDGHGSSSCFPIVLDPLLEGPWGSPHLVFSPHGLVFFAEQPVLLIAAPNHQQLSRPQKRYRPTTHLLVACKHVPSTLSKTAVRLPQPNLHPR